MPDAPLPALSSAPTAHAIQAALDAKTKPPGALGRLETLAAQAARVQGTLAPEADPARVVVFAADHGVAARGVSAYPAEVTAQMVAVAASGGAAVSVLARSVGASVEVVDVGVASDTSGFAGVQQAVVRRGTRDLTREPAMTEAECAAAREVGREAARRAARAGVRTLALGEMGIGNTTAAAALVAALTGVPPEAAVGRGTGVDAAGLARKVAAVQTALARGEGVPPDRPAGPLATLARLGGLEIAALVGAMLEAPAHRMLVLVDGVIATAAALVAVRAEPSTAGALVFAHRSADAGHAAALHALGAEPLLDLGMRLGEGTGAVLAVPLVRAACAMLCEMATFEGAGVSGPEAAPATPSAAAST
ncbi:MAG: nicotinate-nucleotide--dimethylbenzimidazole phosphoribosyltransferase [Rubricoccaceae bacterium]